MRGGYQAGVQRSNLDGVDPPCTLMGGHSPPFASNRRIDAARACKYRLFKWGGGREGKFCKPIEEHSQRCTVWQ